MTGAASGSAAATISRGMRLCREICRQRAVDHDRSRHEPGRRQGPGQIAGGLRAVVAYGGDDQQLGRRIAEPPLRGLHPGEHAREHALDEREELGQVREHARTPHAHQTPEDATGAAPQQTLRPARRLAGEPAEPGHRASPQEHGDALGSRQELDRVEAGRGVDHQIRQPRIVLRPLGDARGREDVGRRGEAVGQRPRKKGLAKRRCSACGSGDASVAHRLTLSAGWRARPEGSRHPGRPRPRRRGGCRGRP